MCIGGYWAKPKQATNSPEDYRKMSQDIGFNSLVERDITANTLPTYDFSASLNEEMNIDSNDSYSKRLQRLENEARDEEEFKYAMNTSANQIYYSIFNTDVMSENMKAKLKYIQRQFEGERAHGSGCYRLLNSTCVLLF